MCKQRICDSILNLRLVTTVIPKSRGPPVVTSFKNIFFVYRKLAFNGHSFLIFFDYSPLVTIFSSSRVQNLDLQLNSSKGLVNGTAGRNLNYKIFVGCSMNKAPRVTY